MPGLTVCLDMLPCRAMKCVAVTSVCALVCALSGLVAEAAPQASILPESWALNVKFHDPQRITFQLPGDPHVTTFWYLLFEIANNTGEDVGFYPSFRLVTDTLEVVEGGDDISPSVYDAIFARHRHEYPFAVPPATITGSILRGEDNARASAAVFRMFDKQANGFTIFVSGLSGDIERVRNPRFDATQAESDTNPRFFILRRTLAITYDLPGDVETRIEATPVRRERKWVMR